MDPADGPALAEATGSSRPDLVRGPQPVPHAAADQVDQQVRRYTLTTLTHPGRWDAVLADYEALVAAIDAATRLWRATSPPAT